MIRRSFAALAIAFTVLAASPRPVLAARQNPAVDQAQQLDQTTDKDKQDKNSEKRGEGKVDAEQEVISTFIRVPIAALLGAILALRPRRRAAGRRQPAVVETQIILAIVGAVVMMIVGSNLARAFGIVGAAGLVRYRARIEDPKDAGVMLTTLAVGLASGVGLFGVAAAATVFILVVLWIIEWFEPDTRRLFDLTIKMGKNTDGRRDHFENLLRRHHVDFELRAASDEEVIYEVFVPLDVRRDRVSNALLELDTEGHGAVDWTEKKLKVK